MGVYCLAFFERSEVLFAGNARTSEFGLLCGGEHLGGGAQVDAVELRVDVERAVVPLGGVVSGLERVRLYFREGL